MRVMRACALADQKVLNFLAFKNLSGYVEHQDVPVVLIAHDLPCLCDQRNSHHTTTPHINNTNSYNFNPQEMDLQSLAEFLDTDDVEGDEQEASLAS